MKIDCIPYELAICGSKSEQKQPALSTALKSTAIVLGALAIIAGILVTTGIAHLIGLHTGWALVGGGNLLILIGIALKCVQKKEPEEKKPRPPLNLSPVTEEPIFPRLPPELVLATLKQFNGKELLNFSRLSKSHLQLTKRLCAKKLLKATLHAQAFEEWKQFAGLSKYPEDWDFAKYSERPSLFPVTPALASEYSAEMIEEVEKRLQQKRPFAKKHTEAIETILSILVWESPKRVCALVEKLREPDFSSLNCGEILSLDPERVDTVLAPLIDDPSFYRIPLHRVVSTISFHDVGRALFMMNDYSIEDQLHTLTTIIRTATEHNHPHLLTILQKAAPLLKHHSNPIHLLNVIVDLFRKNPIELDEITKAAFSPLLDWENRSTFQSLQTAHIFLSIDKKQSLKILDELLVTEPWPANGNSKLFQIAQCMVFIDKKRAEEMSEKLNLSERTSILIMIAKQTKSLDFEKALSLFPSDSRLRSMHKKYLLLLYEYALINPQGAEPHLRRNLEIYREFSPPQSRSIREMLGLIAGICAKIDIPEALLFLKEHIDKSQHVWDILPRANCFIEAAKDL